ncbi:hypothetical protein CK203_116775 [Vitis vinifera]|uniref:Uncharacterized protein n=1 Tax=Vitis vinifera TaxID=29760 RepID=A0A438FBN3_VITVI|nr:hypothetical protein CK203_116775 [Vitis vinifera]
MADHRTAVDQYILQNPMQVVGNVCKEEIDWELRPGGMLVQKRNAGDAASSPMIKIKVSHGFIITISPSLLSLLLVIITFYMYF